MLRTNTTTQGQGIPQTFLSRFTEEFTDHPPSKGLLATGIELELGINHKSSHANSTNPCWLGLIQLLLAGGKLLALY